MTQTHHHPLRCDCGAISGTVETTAVNRGICYCDDCQAFAHALQRPADVLDVHGGTEVIQTTANRVRLNGGHDRLACLRLTPKGLMRWYAACCNTPIGNTPAKSTIAFVGLVHNCLEGPDAPPLDTAFGPSRMRVNTKFAHAGPTGEAPPKQAGVAATVLRFTGMLAGVRLTGSYKQTPFFDAAGQPIATPRVLDAAELDEIMRTVNSGS